MQRFFRPLVLVTALLSLASDPCLAQRAAVPDPRPAPGPGEGTCRTDVPPEEVAGILALQALGMYDPPARPEYALTVPLTFHLVRRDNGTGGLTVAELDQNLPILNASYLGAGIQFQRPGAALVINSDFFYDQITTQSAVDALKQSNPVPNTINVYFVDRFHTDGNNPDPDWLCGQSSFTFSSVQGIVMDYNCTVSQNNPSTFTHEVGHYFDLYHTHETSFALECPDGSNCAISGDLLCDTAADPKLDEDNMVGCSYVGDEVRCGDFFDPPVENFMSYAGKPCRTLFSAGQEGRALATLVNLRPNLIGSQLNVVWVDWGHGGFEAGTYSFPYDTLTEGLANVSPGGRVVIKSGSTSGTITIDQSVVVDSFRGPATIGD